MIEQKAAAAAREGVKEELATDENGKTKNLTSKHKAIFDKINETYDLLLEKLEEVAGVIEKYPSDIPPATKTMSEELNSNYIIAHAEFKVTVSEMKQYDDSEAKEYRAKAKEASADVGKL